MARGVKTLSDRWFCDTCSEPFEKEDAAKAHVKDAHLDELLDNHFEEFAEPTDIHQCKACETWYADETEAQDCCE